MYALIIAAVLCAGAYMLLIRYYQRHAGASSITQGSPPQTLPFCSVVIAARNEEHTIRACLHSVISQTYPAEFYEIIVVDDGSEDHTSAIVTDLFPQITLLHTDAKVHGKKHALATGIAMARGEIIVTTDADCVVSPGWLYALMQSFDAHTQCVTGPVLIRDAQDAFSRFQALELAGLAGVTAAGIHTGLHHLANGANMAFRKTAFADAGGFSQHLSYASGDDLFLVQTIAQGGRDRVQYAHHPEAVVYTGACCSWRELFRQRLRWATKVKALPERKVFVIWAFVWICFVMQSIALITAAMCLPVAIPVIIFCIAAIALVEFGYLNKITHHYGIASQLRTYAGSFLRHYGYVICIGILAITRRSYTWKSRKVR